MLFGRPIDLMPLGAPRRGAALAGRPVARSMRGARLQGECSLNHLARTSRLASSVSACVGGAA